MPANFGARALSTPKDLERQYTIENGVEVQHELQARVQAGRQLLLLSATAVFGDRGYHDASMREIATNAGFSVGALYKRFDSKDQLYFEVVEKLFEDIWRRVAQIVAQQADVMRRLAALTEAIFDHFTVNRAFLRIYGVHPPTIGEPYQSRIEGMQAQQRATRALVEAFAQGQRHGLILDYDAEFLGSMFMGMLHRTITDNLTNSRPLPDVPDLMHLFLSGAAPPRHKERRRRITRTKRSVPATVRDGVANGLPPAQLAEAQKRARE